MNASGGDVRVGISGWRYVPWRKTFYPNGLAQRRELEFASRRLRTIEINGSFYALQRPTSYRRWYAETPDDFVFAVKGGRFITHNKKLRDCERPLANFFASGVLALDEKLGPILWQLPPQLGFDEERIAAFFAILPRRTADAAALANEHDAPIKGEPWIAAQADRPLRYAIEVRHESFMEAAFVKLLRKYNVALCVADSAGKWPYMEDVTSDFAYVRLHGAKRLYVSGYGNASLDRWAARIAAWRDGAQPANAILASPATQPRKALHRDVYVYFDNDVKVQAPYDAINLAARLGHGAEVRFPRRVDRTVVAARGREEPRWENVSIKGSVAQAGAGHPLKKRGT